MSDLSAHHCAVSAGGDGEFDHDRCGSCQVERGVTSMRLWMMLFARHARSCRGPPRLKLRAEPKTWMAETINPAMTWIGHRSFRRLLGCIVAATMATTAAAAEFPFERELLLEAKPLPGS